VKPSIALQSHRAAIGRIVEAHRARNARVVGSEIHGTDTDGSDLDLLIAPTPDTSLMDIAGIQVELEKLLGVTVDVVMPKALDAAEVTVKMTYHLHCQFIEQQLHGGQGRQRSGLIAFEPSPRYLSRMN